MFHVHYFNYYYALKKIRLHSLNIPAELKLKGVIIIIYAKKVIFSVGYGNS